MQAAMSTVRTVWLVRYVLDIVLFGLTIGVLAYFGERQRWLPFTAVALVSIVLLSVLRYLESKPMLERLRRLEATEFELTHRMMRCGLQAFFNMGDNGELHLRNTANAAIIERGNRFSLLADTGASYIDPSVRRHWDALKAKLDAGAPLRLLIVNPFCPAKQLRNELNLIATKVDPKQKLDLAYALYVKYPSVEIRFTDQIYCSVFFSENEMMYDPYHLGKMADRLENYFVAFHFVRRQELPQGEFNLFALLRSHFDILWEKGMGFQAFIDTHRAELGHTALAGVNVLSRPRTIPKSVGI